ncbi:MAG: hypothetical protein WEA61_06785 [Anaerolineales bacterium]
MFSDWITSAALLAIYVGCTGLLGNSLRRAQGSVNRAAILAAMTAVLALALTLSLPGIARLGLVVVALVTFCAFAFASFPSITVRPAWFYASGTMLLIFAWSLTLGWFDPALGIGLASVGAGLLAFRRAVSVAG